MAILDFHHLFSNYPLGAFLSMEDQSFLLGLGGKYSWKNREETFPSKSFYFKSFYKDCYLVYEPVELHYITKSDFLSSIENDRSNFFTSFPEIKSQNNDDDLFEKDFQDFINSDNSNLNKIVLISRETFKTQLENIHKLEFLKRSLLFPGTHSYGMWNEQMGMIGSTPELLLQKRNKKITLQALAGTAMIGEENWLLKNKKELKEHEYVLQDIKKCAFNYDINLSIQEKKIKQFGPLIHLETPITGESEISDQQLIKFISELSPTPALGGQPKNEALDFLQQTEYSKKYPSRLFGSCFGFMEPLHSKFIVAIRNVQWSKQELVIESGAGILRESIFRQELLEIHKKRASIFKHYLC